MVEKFNGNCAKNARIKINYTGKKPKVSFSYPDKKNQGGGWMFIYILVGWLFICGLLIVAHSFYNLRVQNDQTVRHENYDSCIEYYEEHYNFNLEVKNNICEDELGELSFGEKLKQFILSDLDDLFIAIILLNILFIPPLIIYYLDREGWNKFYPKFQAAITRKKYVCFKNQDVKKDLEGNYYCEIPLFENVILSYNATKDFSKYLKFFEIREHNFKWFIKERLKIGKKKIMKRPVNDYLWYAKFYFSKKPINGKLEVEFK